MTTAYRCAITPLITARVVDSVLRGACTTACTCLASHLLAALSRRSRSWTAAAAPAGDAAHTRSPPQQQVPAIVPCSPSSSCSSSSPRRRPSRRPLGPCGDEQAKVRSRPRRRRRRALRSGPRAHRTLTPSPPSELQRPAVRPRPPLRQADGGCVAHPHQERRRGRSLERAQGRHRQRPR